MHLPWYCSVVHKELEPNSVTVGKGHTHRQCQWHQKTIVAIARREVGLQVWRCACGEVVLSVHVGRCGGVHMERWCGGVHVERWCEGVHMERWCEGVHMERRCGGLHVRRRCGGVHVERRYGCIEVWKCVTVEYGGVQEKQLGYNP